MTRLVCATIMPSPAVNGRSKLSRHPSGCGTSIPLLHAAAPPSRRFPLLIRDIFVLHQGKLFRVKSTVLRGNRRAPCRTHSHDCMPPLHHPAGQFPTLFVRRYFRASPRKVVTGKSTVPCGNMPALPARVPTLCYSSQSHHARSTNISLQTRGDADARRSVLRLGGGCLHDETRLFQRTRNQAVH